MVSLFSSSLGVIEGGSDPNALEEERPLIRLLFDDHARGHACTVAGLRLHTDQDRSVALLGRLAGQLMNLKLCAGTTRSSWSAVITMVAG
jgi:hypothetical protein